MDNWGDERSGEMAATISVIRALNTAETHSTAGERLSADPRIVRLLADFLMSVDEYVLKAAEEQRYSQRLLEENRAPRHISVETMQAVRAAIDRRDLS